MRTHMNTQEQIEENEFNQLVDETRSRNFSRSKELSKYIVDNKLGFKYKNISGILEMEGPEGRWKFKGGFPPKMYARLCRELGLGNEGTEAKPRDFTPYKDLLASGANL